MTTIYNLNDVYHCNKEDVIKIYITDEKLTKDDLLYIFTFTNLEYLGLIKNDIEEIPQEISNLKKLINLGIVYNHITRLPTNIKDLNLYYLNISENNISLFQDEILELENLELLIINNNKITEIPKKINKLRNLRNFKLGNVDGNEYVLLKTNNIIKRLDISNLKIKYNQNSILKLPDEIANLQFLVNFYAPDIKDDCKIFGEDMIIFDSNKIKNIIIPENIKNLTILFTPFPNPNILNLLNNLHNGIERLSLSNVNINIKLDNLPITLKALLFYTAPYFNLIEPYSYWPRHIIKEDIMEIKIPFGCEVFLNDEEIKFYI